MANLPTVGGDSGTWGTKLNEYLETEHNADGTHDPGVDTTAVHDNVAGEIAAVAEKTAPVAGDYLLIEDGEDGSAKKKVDIDNLPSQDLSGYVAKTSFDAHSILAATTDNTPAALTVGEQTVIGRITGGNIAALSAAQLATLALSTALPENTAIILDAELSADGKYSGFVETGVAGAALAFGNLIYLAVADSRWELTDASAEATSGGVKVGICVRAAAADGDPTTILLFGKVRADAAFPTLTVGAPVYIGETAGGIVVTAPPTSGAIVRILGYGNTSDELHFCPSNDWIELA